MDQADCISDVDRFARFQNQCADVFIRTAHVTHSHDQKFVAICADQFNFMANRSSALLELIKIRALWDAQILARPIIESCLKVCYLCFTPKSSRLQRCHEYEEILGAVNALKAHDKASKTTAAAGGHSHPTLDGLVLSVAQQDEIKGKFPKELRKEVESRWGFTRLAGELDKQFTEEFGLAPFATFFHTYELSSHIIHADEMGLGAMRARGRLEEPRLTAIEQSHRLALLDVVAGSAMLSALAISWATETNLDEAASLIGIFGKVHDGTY